MHTPTHGRQLEDATLAPETDASAVNAPLTLTHPRVIAARQKWEAQRCTKGKLGHVSFEEWFRHFQSDEKSLFPRLAKHYGVARESIRLTYTRYFADVFQKTAGERVRACIVAREAKAALCREQRALEQSNILFIRTVTARLGVAFRYVPHTKRPHQRHTRVLLNGALCELHVCSQEYNPGNTKNRYAHAHLTRRSLNECAYMLVHVSIEGHPEHCFVLPCDVLQARFAAATAETHTVYIPLGRPSYRTNNIPKVDWWQYADAWHVFTAI